MYATLALCFAGATTLIEQYLNGRQLLKYKEKAVPVELSAIVDENTYEKARVYNSDKLAFGSWRALFDVGCKSAVIYFGLLPKLWAASAAVYTRAFASPPSEIVQSMVYVVLSMGLSSLSGLPWDVYYHFCLEEKHGFNRQTVGFFIKDKIKSFLLIAVIIELLLPPLILLLQNGGPYFFFYVWGLLLAFSLFFITIYPEYIAPLFDKYEPLKNSPLKDKIEALARRIAFPLTKLLVVDGSKRSSHSNAYFYGFFKNKRIVLFDTILPASYHAINNDTAADKATSTPTKPAAMCTEEEVVAILSHELGHWSHNHVLKNFLISQIDTLATFALFGTMMHNADIFNSFGFFSAQPTVIGLQLILEMLFEPINFVKMFAMTALTRVFEYQADTFAYQLGHGRDLKSALIKIHKSNLGNMNPDHLYSLFKFSHPTLLERLRALDAHEQTSAVKTSKKKTN